MVKQRRTRGVLASTSGVELMEQAKAEKRLTNESIASAAVLDVKTVGRFLNRDQHIDRMSARSIVAVLELEFNDVVSSTQSLTSQVMDDLGNESDGKQADNLIQGFEDGLTKYLKSEESESSAIKWLELNQDEIVNVDSIRNEIAKINSNSPIYENVNAENLSKDLKRYLEAIHYCLELGSLQFIDAAIEEYLIPSTYDTSVYVHFLEFIRDLKISNKAPLSLSNKISVPLNYLIRVLPMKL